MKVAFHDMERCVTIIAFVVIYGRIGFFTPLLLDRGQPSATSPLFFDNLHFEPFDKSVNHKSTLKCFVERFEMEIVEKRGLVADG